MVNAEAYHMPLPDIALPAVGCRGYEVEEAHVLLLGGPKRRQEVRELVEGLLIVVCGIEHTRWWACHLRGMQEQSSWVV